MRLSIDVITGYDQLAARVGEVLNLGDGITVRIVNRDPHWMDRPQRQPPLFLSAGAVRLVRYIRSHCAEPRPRKGTPLRGDLEAYEITWSQIATFLVGEHTPLPQRSPTRMYVDSVMKELREANMLGETGYGIYILVPEIAAVVSDEDPFVSMGAA